MCSAKRGMEGEGEDTGVSAAEGGRADESAGGNEEKVAVAEAPSSVGAAVALLGETGADESAVGLGFRVRVRVRL